jgi:hypothetical protein
MLILAWIVFVACGFNLLSYICTTDVIGGKYFSGREIIDLIITASAMIFTGSYLFGWF